MGIAGCTLVAFGFCFMPQPIQFENIPIEEFEMQTPDGEAVDPIDYAPGSDKRTFRVNEGLRLALKQHEGLRLRS